jgi:hypothetical protein
MWWEARRIPYNLIVGTAGICTCIALGISAYMAEEFFHTDFLPDPPIFVLLLILIFGVGANICFTFGWVVELLMARLAPHEASAFAENTFFCGLLFSVALTLSPAILFIFVDLLELISHLKA